MQCQAIVHRLEMQWCAEDDHEALSQYSPAGLATRSEIVAVADVVVAFSVTKNQNVFCLSCWNPPFAQYGSGGLGQSSRQWINE